MEKETTIYIQKELTPEVLKSLKEDHYFVVDQHGQNCLYRLATLIEFTENFKDQKIVLPVTVTTDMVEKEAATRFKYWNEPYSEDAADYGNFKEGVDWLLNYKEDNK